MNFSQFELWLKLELKNHLIEQLNLEDMEASDIHIEPTEHFLLIRVRKDGDFLLLDKVDRENISAVVTRLKVLSKIKIDEYYLYPKKATLTFLDNYFIVK